MSEEQNSVPQRGGAAAGGPQGGLLAQMDLLMAALNADLSALDAELQGAGGAGGAGGRGGAPGASGGGCARSAGASAADGPSA
ncbi:hypothetical protein OIE82_08140 [Streptomyces althioticus]|uniref:Uncharacterized protein n=1 Tax=Streptomyces althioticus TaxID=83380 RepID=A0ABZ1Y441_9ACTN|nr:hypothetical protein OG968_08215 [Streptomyces althioticus]